MTVVKTTGMQIQSHRDTTMADHRLNPTLRHLQRCYRGEVDFKSIEKLDDVNLMHDLPASRVAEHREKVALRPDDVFVATYPKSGTTWMQQIVKLIACNGVETGVNHDEFVPWIDHMSLEEIESMPSPRFFKSHLPYQLMPGGGDPEKANGKYISVIRNPKDVAVSLYVFMQKVFPSDMAISWEEFLDKYCNGEAIFGTFYAHFLGWWEHRNAPNILIVTFEEMRRDLKSVVGRVCNFLGYNLSEQEIGKIAEQTVFDEMKTNPAANKDYIEPVTFGGTAFMRKGIVGDWRNMFTPKQSAMIDSLVGDKLHGTGLVFDYGLEN